MARRNLVVIIVATSSASSTVLIKVGPKKIHFLAFPCPKTCRLFAKKNPSTTTTIKQISQTNTHQETYGFQLQLRRRRYRPNH